MSARDGAPPPHLEVVRQSPLVVLAVVEAAGDPALLAGTLLERFPDESFMAIVAVESDDALEPLLQGVVPGVQELIFTASASPGAIPGDALAMRALEELGVGQDFVFTVPLLGDALAYALAAIAEGPGRGWEGTAILVPGSRATIAQARRWIADAGGRT